MAKGMTIKDALKQFEDDTGIKAKDAKVVKLIGKIPMIDKMDASLSQLEACEQLSLSTNKIEKIANLNGLKRLTILSVGRNAIKTLVGIEAVNDTLVELWCSYNLIDKFKGLTGMKKLKACEQLSLSTNKIEKIANLNGLKRLTILSVGRNAIKTLVGIEAVNDTLVELWCSYNLIDKFKGLTGMKKLKVLHMAHNKVADVGEVGKLSSIPTLEDVLLIGNPIEEAKSEEGVWMAEVKKRVPKLKKLDGVVLVGDTEEA
ncbi:dynein light chain 1, axonemal [Plakobranchus ocellatus]|uniref:Dynein light chain 1, axonemal n=1 Tax=Plakobranchus ocellatus TaxID=259542 RepID=A0AAV4DQ08_9GAST|nr:dynein light chain 1, axonemal [Plakobranchus ocellatus]